MTITDTTRVATRILRFDRVQRAAHWANAALFGVLMFTAIPLYFGSLFGVVLARHVVEMIHLWSGLALPLPIIVSLLGPWGRQMRRDVRRINYWTRYEIHWLRTLGKSRLEADKFNPGQKLNAIFIGAAIIVMLATGAMLQWFRFFPVPWRQGATFVHDTFSYVIFAVVIGHVFMALTHPGSLRSMFTGWVSEKWAATQAAGWLKEKRLAEDSPDVRCTPRGDRR
ncbi:MAG TPA: cytochrome b/b6 domain-containing protein [Acidimicrobiales bacterium]|nr:cytochrome b/b6 domain-containing protein [Acidimicrobiales bacterium]